MRGFTLPLPQKGLVVSHPVCKPSIDFATSSRLLTSHCRYSDYLTFSIDIICVVSLVPVQVDTLVASSVDEGIPITNTSVLGV